MPSPSSIAPEEAATLLGRNFFGVESAIRHFGVAPTSDQIAALSAIPFSRAVLEQCKDTHVLVAVFPISIVEIRSKMGSELFCDQDWYYDEPFANERSKSSWQLVRKTAVRESISKEWEEQQSLIGKDDEIPSAQPFVYAITGHYFATGERLFQNLYVRTSSVDLAGSRVCVGFFDSQGLTIDDHRDTCRCDYLGVSSSRIPTEP